MDMIGKYSFDGLDLDYEFPDSADRDIFAAWVRELKAAFTPSGYELTAAVSASESKIRWLPKLFGLQMKWWWRHFFKLHSEGLDVPSISRDLDAIHVMAYDFHGSWERMADHHSRLAETGKEFIYMCSMNRKKNDINICMIPF